MISGSKDPWYNLSTEEVLTRLGSESAIAEVKMKVNA